MYLSAVVYYVPPGTGDHSHLPFWLKITATVVYSIIALGCLLIVIDSFRKKK